MSRFFIGVFLILLVYQSKPQDSITILKEKVKGISISYFAEYLTHYGLKVGTEYPLWSKEKIKVRRNSKAIHKNKSVFITGNIGCYIHKRYHTGLFINSEIGYRKTRNKGLTCEYLLGIGYLHTFLQGDTYRVNDNGSVERVILAGQSNLMTSLAFGLGYNFNYHFHKPFSLYLKPGFFIQYPYNTAIAIRPTIESGIFYFFK
jgi:hypothetical protein